MQLPGVSDAAGEFSFHSRNAQRVSIFPRDLHGWVLFFAPLIPCPYRPRLAAVQPNPQMWPNKLFSSYRLSTLYQARVERSFFFVPLYGSWSHHWCNKLIQYAPLINLPFYKHILFLLWDSSLTFLNQPLFWLSLSFLFRIIVGGNQPALESKEMVEIMVN